VAVVMFLEIARKEHIPKKYANRMLPTKTELSAMLIRFSMVLFIYLFPFNRVCSSHTNKPIMIKAPGASTINPLSTYPKS